MSEDRLSRWLSDTRVALPLLLLIIAAQVTLAYLGPRIGGLAGPHGMLFAAVPGGLAPVLLLAAAGSLALALLLQGAWWLFLYTVKEARPPFSLSAFVLVVLALFATLLGVFVRELLSTHGVSAWITYLPDFLNIIVIVLFAIRGRLALERRGLL